MSVWVQIILAALSLVREIIKLERRRCEKKADMPLRLKEMRGALKIARETGDTDEIERLFNRAKP